MDRRIVLAGGAIVAAATIVLAVKLRASDPSVSRARTPEPEPEPVVVDRSRPHLEARQPGTPSISETVTETSRVRDHRTGDRVAYDPEARTGEKRTAQRLPPELVHSLSKQLEAAMVECTAAIPADARGPRPGVSGSVFVDVAGGSLQVTETAIELRDLAGEAAATAKQCMAARWVGQTVPASDGVAATHYEISVVFAVSSR